MPAADLHCTRVAEWTTALGSPKNFVVRSITTLPLSRYPPPLLTTTPPPKRYSPEFLIIARRLEFRAVFSLSFPLVPFRGSFLPSISHHTSSHLASSSSSSSPSSFPKSVFSSVCLSQSSVPSSLSYHLVYTKVHCRVFSQAAPGSIIRRFLIVDIQLFLIEPFRCRLVGFSEFELALLIVRVTQDYKSQKHQTALSSVFLFSVPSRFLRNIRRRSERVAPQLKFSRIAQPFHPTSVTLIS